MVEKACEFDINVDDVYMSAVSGSSFIERPTISTYSSSFVASLLYYNIININLIWYKFINYSSCINKNNYVIHNVNIKKLYTCQDPSSLEQLYRHTNPRQRFSI